MVWCLGLKTRAAGWKVQTNPLSYGGTPNRIYIQWQFVIKMGHSRPLFLYFRLFYKQLTVHKCSIKVADDWIRTRVLWYWKRPLCQLRHNHCPNDNLLPIPFSYKMVASIWLTKFRPKRVDTSQQWSIQIDQIIPSNMQIEPVIRLKLWTHFMWGNFLLSFYPPIFCTYESRTWHTRGNRSSTSSSNITTITAAVWYAN